MYSANSVSARASGPAASNNQVLIGDTPYPRDSSYGERVHVKTYVLLALMMLFGTVGNVMLDRGMKRMDSMDLSSTAALLGSAGRILASGAIWAGIACLLFYMLSQMLVLSWADYSFVMPFTAISYVLVALAGHLWLGEPVTLTRWSGIAFIVFGVFLVSRTPTSTVSPDQGTSGMGVG